LLGGWVLGIKTEELWPGVPSVMQKHMVRHHEHEVEDLYVSTPGGNLVLEEQLDQRLTKLEDRCDMQGNMLEAWMHTDSARNRQVQLLADRVRSLERFHDLQYNVDTKTHGSDVPLPPTPATTQPSPPTRYLRVYPRVYGRYSVLVNPYHVYIPPPQHFRLRQTDWPDDLPNPPAPVVDPEDLYRDDDLETGDVPASPSASIYPDDLAESYVANSQVFDEIHDRYTYHREDNPAWIKAHRRVAAKGCVHCHNMELKPAP
jgi:uncharacterized coiled-coil protein SlyX